MSTHSSQAIFLVIPFILSLTILLLKKYFNFIVALHLYFFLLRKAFFSHHLFFQPLLCFQILPIMEWDLMLSFFTVFLVQHFYHLSKLFNLVFHLIFISF